MLRTTLILDDDLVKEAAALTGIVEPSELVRAGLKALIARAKARRIAAFGGSEPDLQPTPRRRSIADHSC